MVVPGWSCAATFRALARLYEEMKEAPSRESPKEGSSVPSNTGSPVRFSKSLISTDLVATGAGALAGAGTR